MFSAVAPTTDIVSRVNDELPAWSPSEHCAAVIDIQHSGKVAWIAQTVFNRPIRRVNVLLRGMKHDGCEQPAWAGELLARSIRRANEGYNRP
jgi:hypothetical protein